MSKRQMFFVCGITLLLCNLQAFSQQFDISLEGPWILYQYPKFDVGGGGVKNVLVAIAPDPTSGGHAGPVFTAGNGAPIATPGIYCLGVTNDDVTFTCGTNDLTKLNHGQYADPSLVPVYTPPMSAWDYTTVATKGAYVIILPMPDLYSADGQERMDFETDVPTIGTPSVSSANEKHAMSVQLHYLKGPGFFQLLACAGTPSLSTCNITKLPASEPNSGTLRITIKNNAEPVHPECNWHVHAAYNHMLHLIDPNLDNSGNKPRAYTGVQDYSFCMICDPQNPNRPSDGTCPPPMGQHSIRQPNIAQALDQLVKFLGQLRLADSQKVRIETSALSTTSESIQGKFPTLSWLLDLESLLADSERGLNSVEEDLMSADRAHSKNDNSLAHSLRVAAGKEQLLQDAVLYLMDSATNGKDCRAAAMLVQ